VQRVSSVIQFINSSLLPPVAGETLPPLLLQGCDLVTDLNGNTYESLPLLLKLRIKRSSIRTVIIKRQSKLSFLKYDIFNRLNTGGDILAPQEIRNCLARMVGEDGVKFYNFLQQQTLHPAFISCVETLAEADKDKRGYEELVLRFFATKNAQNLCKGSVRDWLDDYMKNIILKKIEFDYEIEEQNFNKLFTLLFIIIGSGAFVKYRDNHPIGGLAPAHYEAITVGTFQALEQIIDLPPNLVKQKIIDTVQTEEFKQYTGSGANQREKLRGRINTIKNSLLELVSE
jgi:hypothetical protein